MEANPIIIILILFNLIQLLVNALTLARVSGPSQPMPAWVKESALGVLAVVGLAGLAGLVMIISELMGLPVITIVK